MADKGRPTVITQEVLRKLEEAFSLGCTDLEACLYANISKSTLYDYQKANPDFLERKEKLKEAPILLARKTVIDSLKNPLTAQWYLERKKKDEFATRVENTGRNGEPLIPTPILGDLNVHPHHGDPQDSPTIEANQGDSGRDISEQDNLNPAIADTPSPERPETDANERSI